MKKNHWKRDFPPHILDRGEQYYLSGAVQSLRREGDVVFADVMGTERYEVELAFQDGELADAWCSCPYAEDGDYCKHMAAVLFQLEEEQADDTKLPDRKDTLERQIASLTEQQAKELLLQLALKHTGGAELVEAAAAGTVSAAQVKRWEHQIRQAAEDRYGYTGYDSSWEDTEELTDLLNERVPLLLSTGQPMEAFSLICTAVSEAANAEYYEDDEDYWFLFERSAQLWKDVIRASDEDQRRKQHEWFAGTYLDEDWEFGMEAVEEVLFDGFPDEALQRENLSILDRRISEEIRLDRSYALEHLIRTRLKVMETLGVGREETDRFLEEHFAVPAVREQMIQRAIGERDFDRAIALLKESRELDREMRGLVQAYQEQLIDLYRQLGRTEDQRDAIRYLLSAFYQRDLQYITMLKDLTPPEDWPALREEVLTWRGCRTVAGLLLEEEQLYDRLMSWVMEQGQLFDADQFSASLWPVYPEKLMAFYLDHLQEEMGRASNRKTYAELIRRLKELRKRPNGEKETARLAQTWRAAYPRRRAMLDELSKAGF